MLFLFILVTSALVHNTLVHNTQTDRDTMVIAKLNYIKWSCTTWLYSSHESPPIDTGYLTSFNDKAIWYKTIDNKLGYHFYVFDNVIYNQKDIRRLILPWCWLTLNFVDFENKNWDIERELYAHDYCTTCRNGRVETYENIISNGLGNIFKLHIYNKNYIFNFTKFNITEDLK